MANFVRLVFCLVGLGFSSISASYDGVPALLWTNTKADFPTPLAGHTTRQSEFTQDYLQKNAGKAGHVLLTFIQDKLSLEDIIDNADVYNEHSTGSKFANLKHLVETHPSVHLPAVYSPGESINKLADEFKGKVHHLKAPYNIKHIALDPNVENLIITHLPHNDGKSFDKVDKIIGTLTEDLKSLNMPFTAVYTGERSSKVPEETVYTGRHLLSYDDLGDTYFNITDCILMYYKSLTLDLKVGKDKKPLSYTLRNGTTDGSKCGNGTGKLVVTYPKHEDLEKFSFTMDFKYDRYGFWQTTLMISYSVQNTSVSLKTDNVKMQSDMIYGPERFSYHCSEPYPISQITKGNSSEGQQGSVATLRIKEFQIQFGHLSKGKFGRANDCEGFFSAPVLSGLFAGIILTSILAFGICMIVNISTMDRFDDPKGKTISVNTAE